MLFALQRNQAVRKTVFGEGLVTQEWVQIKINENCSKNLYEGFNHLNFARTYPQFQQESPNSKEDRLFKVGFCRFLKETTKWKDHFAQTSWNVGKLCISSNGAMFI